ncbi:ATP-binding cassette domain-containing protein [Rathayibacter sp. YIM 133350]|uniref:ABC transporter ATP-binding protein n=1 Tax=Rathayibacter sp. YIM 133350 TaxID=3131992 RepID=UPI00307F6AA5
MTDAPPRGGAAVRAEGWSWRHAGRSDWAVRDLDLTIEPGERVLLLGPSGAGKSTLLHGLAGVLGGSEDGDEHGRLLVDGGRPSRRRDRVGMVLQDPDAQVILSRVGDDVAFGMENLRVPRSEIWQRVTRALAQVGLVAPLRSGTEELSGGQKQRLALAGVLAMNPGLILLDEPTANLDPAGVCEVRDAIAGVAAETGATLLVIEHRTEIWLPVVDRVLVMDRSGVLGDGDPARVIERQREQLLAAGVWVPGAPLPRLERDRSTDTSTLLTATGLSVGRPGAQVGATIDVGIRRGRTTAVVGPNGAGKSTLALTLGGLLAPGGGRLEAAADFAPDKRRLEPLRWRSKELLTRIGSVFQDPEHQFLAASVREELAIGPRALKRDAQTTNALTDELLARLRLDRLADANPYTLSGGEKRRLSVATVLATQPELIILDEPTFGQDRRTWEELVKLIAEIVDAGTAVVAVSHDEDFASLLADDVLELPAWQPEPSLAEVTP